jgi:hypothetical protein
MLGCRSASLGFGARRAATQRRGANGGGHAIGVVVGDLAGARVGMAVPAVGQQ